MNQFHGNFFLAFLFVLQSIYKGHFPKVIFQFLLKYFKKIHEIDFMSFLHGLFKIWPPRTYLQRHFFVRAHLFDAFGGQNWRSWKIFFFSFFLIMASFMRRHFSDLMKNSAPIPTVYNFRKISKIILVNFKNVRFSAKFSQLMWFVNELEKSPTVDPLCNLFHLSLD